MYRNLEFNTLPNEIWKPIKGFENLYEVSNLGRVKSIFTKFADKNGKIMTKKQTILKQCFTSTGYLMVNLNHKPFKVHRLVATAFIPNPNNKPQVNHIDFNPLNNKVQNLEWATSKENINHTVSHNRSKRIYYFDIEKAISLFKSGKTAKEISIELQTNMTSLQNFFHRRKIKRKNYPKKSKYNITIEQLKELFKQGYSNKQIMQQFNIPNVYVARRRYQIKKGEI